MHAPKLTGCQHDCSSSTNEIEVSDLDDGEGPTVTIRRQGSMRRQRHSRMKIYWAIQAQKKMGGKNCCYVLWLCSILKWSMGTQQGSWICIVALGCLFFGHQTHYQAEEWSGFLSCELMLLPVFLSDISKLQQQVYVWCNGIASCAEKAVEVYFDQQPCFDDPAQCAAYVTWAVCEPTEKLDKSGQKFLVLPSECPHMWASLMMMTWIMWYIFHCSENVFLAFLDPWRDFPAPMYSQHVHILFRECWVSSFEATAG